MNNFYRTFRTFAFPENLIEKIPLLIEFYGEDAYDGLNIYKTIACGWDDSNHTKFRALRFPETASLTDLKDGRKAYTALWSIPLLQAFENGLFPEVQELTIEELQSLIYQEEFPNYPIEEPQEIV